MNRDGGQRENGRERSERIAAASDWFARMRGPGAAAARDAFGAWKADPDNARAYEEVAAVWELARACERAPGPAPSASRSPKWLAPGSIAAGLVAALALAFVVYHHTIGSDRAPALHYASSSDALREVRLADGSHVTLDSGSHIAVAFVQEERRVTLRSGRARFSVAHGRARPFVVLAAGQAIVARGTLFDVRLARGAVEVTLLEGAVDLEQRAKGMRPKLIGRLRPGQAAQFAAGRGAPHIVAARPDPWPMGIVAGEGMRLGDIIAEANGPEGPKIILARADLADLRISGGVRPRDRASLATSLAAALDLSVKRESDGTIVLARTVRTSAPAQSCRGHACRTLETAPFPRVEVTSAAAARRP